MAKKTGTGSYTEVEYRESVDPALKGLVMQQVGQGQNAHEVFNELLRQNRSKRLYTADGQTRPVQALALHLEAERDIRHSVKLARNLKKSGATKEDGDESHHVVAARARAANLARQIIFAVGIGINDSRNGVNLETAIHRPVHTDVYYMAVNNRLALTRQAIMGEPLEDRHERIGLVLVAIGEEIANRSFPR